MPPSIAAFFAKYGAALIGLALALLATFGAGKLHERAAWEARRADKIQEARVTERDGAAIANTAETDALKAERERRENADAEITLLREQLAKTPKCPVPRNVVRLLDGTRVPTTAAAAARAGAAAARVAAGTGGGDPDAVAAPSVGWVQPITTNTAGDGLHPSYDTVDASVVLENCAHNRLHVAEPNAAHIEALQKFYDALRARYNTP